VIDARYYYDDLDIEMQSVGYTDVLFLYNVNTLSEDNCLVPVLNNEQGGDYSDSNEGDGSTESDGSTENNTSTEDNASTEDNTSTEDGASTEDNTSTENDTSTEDNTSNDDGASTEDNTATENGSGSEESALTVNDIAFIGDSRTLSMATGGKLAYGLVPSSSVYATWGGKITDSSASANTQAAANAQKKVAIFWFGINDVQSSDLTIRNDVALFCSNYENLIDLYRKTNPNSNIVVLSILTTSTQEKDYYEGQEDNIIAYNNALQALCNEKNYTYIDISSLYTGDECFADGDYIHFSKEWYEDVFLPHICGVLEIK
jgi:lysophospholipase L1-like esterase